MVCRWEKMKIILWSSLVPSWIFFSSLHKCNFLPSITFPPDTLLQERKHLFESSEDSVHGPCLCWLGPNIMVAAVCGRRGSSSCGGQDTEVPEFLGTSLENQAYMELIISFRVLFQLSEKVLMSALLLNNKFAGRRTQCWWVLFNECPLSDFVSDAFTVSSNSLGYC